MPAPDVQGAAQLSAAQGFSFFPSAWENGTSVLIDQGLSTFDMLLLGILGIFLFSLITYRSGLRDRLQAEQVQERALIRAEQKTRYPVPAHLVEEQEAIAVLDGASKVIEANTVFIREVAASEAQVLGQPIARIDPRGFGGAFWAAAFEECHSSGHWQAERLTVAGQGETANLHISLRPIAPDLSEGLGGDRVVLRIGASPAGQPSYPGALGQNDKLTGLLNRRSMKIRTEAALVSAQAEGRNVALIVIDLDRFTDINSAFGDGIGDRVLCRCAKIMEGVAAPDMLLARTGGDEFAILLSGQARGEVEQFAKRVLDVLGREMDIGGLRVRLSASAGVALFPDDAQTQRRLMQSAGRALASAKEMGRGQVRSFFDGIKARSDDSLKLELDLRRGLKRGELFMHYQPQVHMRSGTCVGSEALLRWDHPERGLLLPGAFIPMALDVGLTASIDRFALEQVCRQIHAWRSEGLGVLPVSVNIALTTLMSQDFMKLLRESLTEWDIPFGVLQIELVESVHFPKLSETSLDLSELRELGISLAIDDFGTGYSSVSMLKDLPINRIKIDRRFVDQIAEDRRDDRIVAALIGMGKGLDLCVVAEGVESDAQKEHLLSLGCSYAQGFLFNRPMPPQKFAQSYLLAQSADGALSRHQHSCSDNL